MVKSHKMALSIIMHLFFLCMTLSFSPALPDMDYIPRLITASVFLVPFSILSFLVLKQNKYTIPKNLYINAGAAGFLLLILALFISRQSSILPGDSTFDMLKFFIAFLYLLIFSLLSFFNSDLLKTFAQSITVPLTIILITGLFQLYSIKTEAERLGTPFEVGYQLSSLLSNKNSLAEFILLCLPLSVYSILTSNTLLKILSSVNLLFSLILLYFLQSFSVNIALASLMIITGILIVFTRKEKIMQKLKLSRMGFTVGIVAVFVLFSAATFAAISKIDGFTKISLIAHYLKGGAADETMNENSVYERLLLWRNSLAMIRENIFTGIGLGNWKILFPSYGYGGARYMIMDTVKFTRAHNDFLQVFAETGLFGFIGFAGMLFYSMVKAVTNYFKSRSVQWLVLTAGVFSYSIVALFGFPTEKVMLVMMMVIYLALISGSSDFTVNSKKINVSKFAFLILIIPVVTCLFSVKVCASRIKEEALFKQVVYFQERSNWQRMYALTKNINPEYFPLDYTATPVAWYQATASYMNGKTEEALDQYKIAQEQAPFHVQIQNDLGAVYLNSGNYAEAEKYFNNALRINPKFPDALFNKAVAVFNKGNKYGAYSLFRELGYTHQPPKYNDYMFTVVNAVADSIFKARKIDLSKPILKEDIRGKNYIYQVEVRSFAAKTDFLSELEKEINAYNKQ